MTQQNVSETASPDESASTQDDKPGSTVAANSPGSSDQGSWRLKKSTIMMVDDEPTTMEVIKAWLVDAGYTNIVETSDSTQAMGVMSRERPDVLLLDLNMPDVTGFDILASMREEPDLQHVPVIVLTSSTEGETKLKALELGAADFLAKPVDSSELTLRLRNTLAAKAYQDSLAHYDALTGLPNRGMFLQRLGAVLGDARLEGKNIAVVQFGIDRFKKVNDTLGLHVGDALLREVARRLEQHVSVSDTATGPVVTSTHWGSLSRIGGDEFAALLPDILRVDGVSSVARRIMALMAKPFHLENHEVFITPSIGIAVFPNDGDDADTLVKHAGIAMGAAKQHGGNTYQYFAKDVNARSTERLTLENDLRRALANDELLLHYQPKVDVKTGRVRGVEGLLRWQHPEHGMLPPGKFIPLAEEMGLITKLGDWVFHEACRQSKLWEDAGLGIMPVAVNVSAQQFRQQGQLSRTLRDALAISGMEPRHLTVEVTESMIMEDAKQNIATLHEIKDMGVRLSVDDFGTGYSSLSYLKRFPLDELKIDRSFLMDLGKDADDAAIVSAIIAMAHNLGLKVVAEGVETRMQLSFLSQRGCDQCQGYLFSKPIPAEELTALMEKRKRPPVD